MALRALGLLALLGGLLASLAACQAEPQGAPRWWKGNTHAHTLWSDGDAAPELVAAWYRERGYQWLVLSDHNLLSEGERWFPVEEGERSRLTAARVEELRQRFGEQEVVTRVQDGRTEMRLQTLAELRKRFEAPGEFLFLQGEEITDSFEERNVHVNGLNLAEPIAPQGGSSVIDVLQRNIDAVVEQGRRLRRPVLAHVNHPNFTWSLTAEDLARIRGERFFEVYNGHSGVRNHGDDQHPSTEAMWDIALTMRLSELGLGVLYGLATDDSHHYHSFGVGRVNPGRGWIMVRATALEPAQLLAAMQRGDFYATSGVRIADFRHDDESYVVHIVAEPGIRYRTLFRGTRRRGAATGPVGEVLLETEQNPAVYRFSGDEVYVRAQVVSSRLHPNPHAAGDLETAWLQPVVPGRAGAGSR